MQVLSKAIVTLESKIAELRRKENELEQQIEKLKAEIAELMPPNCHVKWTRGYGYVYRTYRKDGKVQTEYLGALTPRWGRPAPPDYLEALKIKRDAWTRIREKYAEIKKIRKQIKQIMKQIRKLETALRKLKKEQIRIREETASVSASVSSASSDEVPEFTDEDYELELTPELIDEVLKDEDWDVAEGMWR